MATKRKTISEFGEVIVRAFDQEWTFEGEVTGLEVLSVISDSTDVKADLLILERRAGDRMIFPGANSVLAPGKEYVVRLRRESVPMRRFGAGVAVSPNSYYYVQPNVDDLVSDLIAGKYCVLCGPRQSGKTTMVMATRTKLSSQSAASVVYLDGLLGAKESWNSSDLWGYLHDCLYTKSPTLFPKRIKPTCNESDYRSLFMKDKLLSPVILVLDEADSLLHLSADLIAEFFAVVRSMKNDQGDHGVSPYNLKAFMLVGVETVRDLIEGQYDKRVQNCLGRGRVYVPSSTPSHLSPFPHDHVLKSERFTYKQVEALLGQAATDRPKVNIEVSAIARSIFEYTGGHRGLTGTCLAYVIQEQLWSFKLWVKSVESYYLGMYVFSMETYSRILGFIRLQKNIPKAHEVLLEFLEVEGVECSHQRLVEELRDFIANGVLALTPMDADTSYVRISTPLLRTAMLRRCTVVSERVDAPPCATVLDRKWLISQTVSSLDGETMSRPECQKARGAGSSEYMLQFLFLCRIKGILDQAYPTIRAKVLFEVKEEIVEGQSRSQLRCDSLIRDGDDFSKFAFEFIANGTLQQITEHLDRALKYHEQHSASVYVVNFCMEKRDEHIVKPSHDALVFLTVNFSPSTKSAKLTFVDAADNRDCYQVESRNWSGNISFANVY